MNKRGQFYIIAAVIIIIVIIGIAAVTNYTKRGDESQQVKVYELTKELNLEGESVANYGIFQDENLDDIFSQFTTDYGQYINNGEDDVYFVYGNATKVKVKGYVKQETGNFQLNIGASSLFINIEQYISGDIKDLDIVYGDNPPGSETNPNVLVEIAGKKYPFEIKRGQNFFFVIKQPSIK